MTKYPAFEEAMKLESAGCYLEAIVLFEKILESNGHDKGDLLFHCGWCLENLDTGKTQEVLEFYKEAADTTLIPVCRMNSFFRIGWLMMQDKDYPGAASYFRKSIDYHKAELVHDELYHQSLYWYAVCQESLGYYIDAIKLHQQIQNIAPLLSPESRYREIQCLIGIGSYEEVLQKSHFFENDPPSGFDKIRYQQLSDFIRFDYQSLQACLRETGGTREEF
jgi:tetratricopeptide (TPR) repeat protein